jgi:esterase/lipase superfamily enzyme
MSGRTVSLDAGTVVVYGHWGRPVLAFPSEGGDAWEFQRQGMVGAIGPLLEAGRVKLYCVDLFDGREGYDSWIFDQVAPFVWDDCGGRTEIATCGCSLGAYHAVDFALRRADLFPLALGLSGRYDPVLDYAGRFGGDHLEWLRGQLSLLLVCGQGQWEDTTGALESTRQLGDLLQGKGIRCEVDVWGDDVPHDWPSWRAQLAHHLPRFL